ncbi:MAG: DUF4097 family beta strand repeat-containing protein [Tepidiformaceae bacterium]
MGTHEMIVSSPNVTCLRVTSRAGRVEIFAEPRADFALLGDATVGELLADGTLSVASASGSSTIGVRCPVDSNVVVGTGSGNVVVSGRVGDLRATSSSGSIIVESARATDLRSESGKVRVAHCESGCRILTASGAVQVGSVASAEVATGSGKVDVASAAGKARVRTASGSVDVGASGQGDIAIETMSGGVTVRLPAGTRPAAKLYAASGRTRCELAQGSDCTVAVRSMDGKIEVISA